MPDTATLTRIKYLLPKYTRGSVLQIGTGDKAYPHFTEVEDALSIATSIDAVFCPTTPLAKDFMHLAGMVKDGGYLCTFVEGDVVAALTATGMNWTVEKMVADGERMFIFARKGEYVQPTTGNVKTACICRFGGYGDLCQSAVILPQLKAAGFHITFMTTPRGKEILKHDLHIDAWYIVDTDQVPNHELPEFWRVQAREYDRFINLSESIEGYLLALPGRVNHAWPYEVRKKRMNANYHEWTAELAGVPFKPCQLFYATEDETAEVAEMVNPMRFNVLWALAGSSIHKFSPHMDAVIARMMLDMPEARLFLVGDEACQLLEQGWENEPRVVRLSNKLPIRKTLALAQACHLVIGPETGVLNAVGMEQKVHKVLMLSHSSEHNLSKHWVNTQALKPKNCDCYPCHRLHYDTEHCDIDHATGAARCAVNIDAAMIYEAVEKVYNRWKRESIC